MVQALCDLLDLVLRHGLRDWHLGYWPVLREFSHSDTLQAIRTLKTVSTSLGKGNQAELGPGTALRKGLHIPPFHDNFISLSARPYYIVSSCKMFLIL
jgi:hypothetical protein